MNIFEHNGSRLKTLLISLINMIFKLVFKIHKLHWVLQTLNRMRQLKEMTLMTSFLLSQVRPQITEVCDKFLKEYKPQR